MFGELGRAAAGLIGDRRKGEARGAVQETQAHTKVDWGGALGPVLFGVENHEARDEEPGGGGVRGGDWDHAVYARLAC